VVPSPAVTPQPPKVQIPVARAQPKRAPVDTKRVREAETTLAAAVVIANDAKTLQEACGGLVALTPKISALQLMRPPAGFERERLLSKM
jgi:hypothetical protein